MDRTKEPDLDRWVADRMTSLTHSGDWDPNLAIALAAFNHRRNSAGVRRTGVVLASAAVLLLSGLLAFPGTRSLARRCVGACIAQTGAVREFLGNGLHMTAAPIQTSERRLAPDFSLPDADGQLLRLSDFRGRIVLLNFWATRSAPSAIEIPWLRDFQHKYDSAGLTILAIAMDRDGWSSVKSYVASHDVTYRVLLGDEAVANSYGGVNALPTTLMIDREGRIAAIHTGVLEKSTYEKEVRTLLAEH